MQFLQSLLLEKRKKGKNTGLTVNGKTADGRSVMGNVFGMYETHGVALEDIIQKFDELGYLVDWVDFYNAAMNGGWKRESTLKKIQYALIDTKGKDYAAQVMQQIEKIS